MRPPRFGRSPHTVRGSFNSLAAPTVVRVPRSLGLKRPTGVVDSCPGWREPGSRVRSKPGILRFRPRPIRIGRDAPARWAEGSSLLGSPGSLVSKHGTDERRATPLQPVLRKRRLAPCDKRVARSTWPVPMLQAVCVPPVSGHASSPNACPGWDPIDRVAGSGEPRENDRQALERQEGVACQAFRSWDAKRGRWTGNQVAKPFRVRARAVSDVRPSRATEGFERLASFGGRRSSSAEESLAWPRIRDERTREAHRDLQV